MTPVLLELLDSGWWTLDVPAARLHIALDIRGSRDGHTTTGRTQEGQRVVVEQGFDGPVVVTFLETGACFTFPAHTRHRHRITGGSYERRCGSGLGYWFRARKGKHCR